jgi:hypothetical protein
VNWAPTANAFDALEVQACRRRQHLPDCRRISGYQRDAFGEGALNMRLTCSPARTRYRRCRPTARKLHLLKDVVVSALELARGSSARATIRSGVSAYRRRSTASGRDSDKLTSRAAGPFKTIYSICSIQAVLQRRGDGERQHLRLDDPVAQHLPWFAEARWRARSPSRLLTRLGPASRSDYPYWSAPVFAFPTHEQIVERVSQHIALYTP